MFCPNCGNETNAQNFCRSCGIRVEKILKLLVTEIEEKEKTKSQKRDDLFRKLGFVSLILLFGLGFGVVFYLTVYYKFLIFGVETIATIGLIAAFVLGLLSLTFYNLPKFLNSETKENETEEARITNKLLAEGNFEPIPSVTENSTELLFVENKNRKNK
ncbi:MAG: zinc ribbon domain-containing protein [Pyrinomonadaceae bacterium]|nr:zinc ribbon domain-containing protein [Pyrinomonadaceae bacterium]